MKPSSKHALSVSTGTEALRLTAAALAAWRLTHLLAAEDGPADVVARIRSRLGTSPLGGLMDCFGCLGVWIAAAFALWARPRRVGLGVGALAVAGAAFLLERATDRETTPIITYDTEGTPS